MIATTSFNNSGSTAISFNNGGINPGTYTLMLGAADGVHAVAYDAVVVRSVPAVTPMRSGNDVVISFATVAGQRYRIEQTGNFINGPWTTLLDNIAGNGGVIPITDFGAANSSQRYYRVVTLP